MKKLILIIATFIICGCSKMGGTYYHISDALRADFNFKQGSYWIYRDSLTGTIDSVVVSQNVAGTNSTTPHNPSEAVHSDYIDMTLTNYPVTSVYLSSDTINWSLQLTSGGMTLPYTQYSTGLYTNVVLPDNGIMSFNVPYPFIYPNSSDNCHIDSITVLQNFLLNSVNYPTVGVRYKASFGCIYTPHYSLPVLSYSDQVYLCPKVGIIKMCINHPLDSVYRVWELVRYHIVK